MNNIKRKNPKLLSASQRNLIFHRLAASLAKIHVVIYILLGMMVTYLLVGFGIISSDEDVRTLAVMPGLLCFVSYGLGWKCCEIFYADKYRSYMPIWGRNIGMPNSDQHFYKTIVSSISFPRKISGYLYVFSKMVTCVSIGVLLMAALCSRLQLYSAIVLIKG